MFVCVCVLTVSPLTGSPFPRGGLFRSRSGKRIPQPMMSPIAHVGITEKGKSINKVYRSYSQICEK